MVTINDHDARAPEETMFDLPPVVPAERARGRAPKSVRETGLPNQTPA